MTEQGKRRGGGVAAKILMPLVASAASALAAYVAKKGPEFLEQTVMPKLRETKESTGDVAHDLTERARSVVGSGGDGGSGGGEESRSSDELEQRRRERAEHRAARRKAS
jgi:malic enzyme